MPRLLARCNPVLLAVAIALPTSAAAIQWTAERAPEWDAVFDRTSGWTGADGIYAIPLSGREAWSAPDPEKTLFLFGDTFIGDVGPDDQRQSGTTMVNNTLGLLDGRSADDPIRFIWRRDQDGDPTAAVVPATPDTEPGDWYWFVDGIALGDKVQVLAMRMGLGDGGVFNFAVKGMTMISHPLSSGIDAASVEQVDAPLFVTGNGARGDIIVGGSVMANLADAGAPAADGFVYIYGTQNDALNKQLVAARVAPSDFEDFSAWRFWDGAQWVDQVEAIAPITGRISSEFSVSPLPDGRFILVFQVDGLGKEVGVRIGSSPVGPFGPVRNVWYTPEADVDPDVYTYNAKAHPHLSPPGSLLISYNVNTFDFVDHLLHADIYRPRFVWLRCDDC